MTDNQFNIITVALSVVAVVVGIVSFLPSAKNINLPKADLLITIILNVNFF